MPLNEYPTSTSFALFGDGQVSIENPTIASAATVAPTARQHFVSGTAAIVNITLPWDTFAGSIIFMPTGIWTWTNAGNIAVAGTTTAATSPVTFTYFQSTGKWYASRLA